MYYTNEQSVSVSKEQYSKIINTLITCNAQSKQIDNLKLKYKQEINSTRRFDCINNIKDLIDVLQKRDCISEQNIEILNQIAQLLNVEIAECCVEHEPEQPDASNSHTSLDLKERIHKLISCELGNSWLDFARGLEFKESELDNLKILYRRDFQAGALEVLKRHYATGYPMSWKSDLLKALTFCKRNDISKEMQKLIDLYGNI